MNDVVCMRTNWNGFCTWDQDMTVVKKGWVSETRVTSPSSLSSQAGGALSSQRSSFGVTFWSERRES
jgi:hypothetical protein